MSKILYWILLITFRSLTYLFRWTLAVYYWKKGKTVPPIRDPILLKSAKKLAEDIRNGKLKSTDIVQAYIDRIREVEPYLNAVVEDRFEEALKEAAKVDELVQSGAFSIKQLEEYKPLLGVPVTVKIMIKVKGLRCTAASRLFKDQVADEDAPCVTLLKNAGGIVIATTNMPEYALALETNNLAYGKTCNPYDTSKTSGGSSGGEAALLAAGASAVGIANDMVGSIRIPAHFCGIYTHKATRGLVSNEGTFPSLPQELMTYISTGPMCRYAGDLVMMMKILTRRNEKYLDFDKKFDFKNLKIFYLTSIGDPKVLSVDEEIVEGIHKAMSHFTTTYDATAQELKLPLINKCNDIAYHVIPATIEDLEEHLTAGKVKELHTFNELFKLFNGNSNFTLSSIVTISLTKCPLVTKKEDVPYYREVLQNLVETFDNLLDDNSVILFPTFPQTAPYHYEMTFFLSLSMCYTIMCNLTGMPATAVPIGFHSNGMPYGIQVIAKNNNDPLTIACAIELAKVFEGWKPTRK